MTFCFALLAVVTAPGAPESAPSRTADRLTYNLPVDAAVTGAALAVWLGSELLKDEIAPTSCRWCDANALDSGVRAGLRWTAHPGAAVTASNVAAYALAPAVGLGLTALAAAHDDRVGEIWVDALLIVEASALAGTLNQVVKFSFGRQRPFAHAGLPNPDPKPGPSDYNLSFYSGHTTFTSSLAAAAGTVATLRGYRWAPVVWFAGGAVAIATGYLRIAADQHYFTDVLTGALLGAGVGVAVPCLFHRAPFNDAGAAADAAAAPRASLAIVPTSGGGALLYAGVW